MAVIFISLSSIAHSPKKMKLKFDSDKKTLSVDIAHKVKDVSSHFIAKVTIFVNDIEVITETYDKQSEKLKEQLVFDMKELKSGDKIKLIAKCNKFGKKSAKLTID